MGVFRVNVGVFYVSVDSLKLMEAHMDMFWRDALCIFVLVCRKYALMGEKYDVIVSFFVDLN